MIEIQHLSKKYRRDVFALCEIDLTIGTGMFGLLGPNGAGKTTLIRLIAGLITPTHGQITVWGHRMHLARERQAAKGLIGYLPQDLGVYPNLTAFEFLDYMAILKGVVDRKTRAQQIQQVIEAVRLQEAADQRLKTYSGGMKRRIGIAQALLNDPKVIIVDEPTAGLDPEERVRFRNMLADLSQDRTVILSTHIIEDVSQSCQELAILERGKLKFHGSPRTLIREARGKVWTILTDGQRPQGVTVVSTLQSERGTSYRVIGDPPAYYDPQSVEPLLEDGYIWKMQIQ
ncbi:MAG: ABC transporter ATP-binding protein [Anaerolineae bacterium]|jgi:ABC-type multidrug transport system ATPase subunit|nr:ABC transporter ATP-binding protein [Anaerolineae bacterium]